MIQLEITGPQYKALLSAAKAQADVLEQDKMNRDARREAKILRRAITSLERGYREWSARVLGHHR